MKYRNIVTENHFKVVVQKVNCAFVCSVVHSSYSSTCAVIKIKVKAKYQMKIWPMTLDKTVQIVLSV